MDPQPDIISSAVISGEWDIFWEDIAPLVEGMPPKDTLVITTPVTPQSADFTQLQKMLQACTLAADDYNLLQLPPDKAAAWYRLRDRLQPRQVILLGIEPAQLGIAAMFMPHQVNRFQDVSWIPTLSISGLGADPDVKKHLWNYGLKPVFVEKAFAAL